MGFGNPQVPWIELEHQLSDRGHDGRPPGSPPWTNAGGDSPAWSRRRQPYKPPPTLERRADAVPYAELHCHSNFSFLDGASHPEELAEEAARLGLEALALTDHDGFYGVVRFAEAAREVGMPTVFGAELTLGATTPQNGVADPEGTHLLVLARGPDGYARPRPRDQPCADGGGEGRAAHVRSQLWLMHGGRLVGAHRLPQGRGAARPSSTTAPPQPSVSCNVWSTRSAATASRSSCGTTVTRSTLPATTRSPSSPLATRSTCIATNNVHYATPARRPLATALAAVRARRSLDEIDRWLPGGAGARTCARAPSRRAGSRATRASSKPRPSSGARARSTSRSSRRTCRRSHVRRATTR